MRTRTLMVWVMVSVAALAGGCGPAAPSAQGPAPTASGDAAKSQPPPPAFQQEGYTILLRALVGPDHVNQALRYKKNTEADAGWKDLYVVHKDGYSELYRGTYPTAKAARADLRQSKNYRTPVKIQPYQGALVVPLPGKEIGPREWNLRNAPGEFTLVIALFRDDPASGIAGHKQYAVDNVRELRKQGLEAYFLHAPAESLVTIGSFPAGAYVSTTGPDRVVRQRIADPRLVAMFERFPNLAVNGYEEVVREKGPGGKEYHPVVTPSYVMQIPHGEDAP